MTPRIPSPLRYMVCVFAIMLTPLIAVGQIATTPEPPPEPLPAPAAPPANGDIRQVQIQVFITETTQKGLKDLGANLTYKRFIDGDEQSGSVQQINTEVHNESTPELTVTVPTPDTALFGVPMRPDRPTSTTTPTLSDGLQSQQGVGGTFTLIKNDYGTIEGAFRATEQNADVNLISKPEFLIINGQLATIHAGGEIPYQSMEYVMGRPELQVKWEPIGVEMMIVPTILPDNQVLISVQQLNVKDVTGVETTRGIDLPVFAKRSQEGQVIVPNRHALAIGGLDSVVEQRSEERVPFLGKLPILGLPFRGRRTDSISNTLLIFISPTIVDLRETLTAKTTALDYWRTQIWRRGDWKHADQIDAQAEEFQRGY